MSMHSVEMQSVEYVTPYRLATGNELTFPRRDVLKIMYQPKTISMNQRISFIAFIALFLSHALAFAQKSYELASPNGTLQVKIDAGATLQWSASFKNRTVISPSQISIELKNGEVLGTALKVTSAKTEKSDTKFATPFYKKEFVEDKYNQLTLNCKGNYGVIFRAYDDGVAYRFFTKRKGDLVVKSEQTTFNFENDHMSFVPYVRDLRGTEQYIQSFEALYSERNISKQAVDTLGFLPILVDATAAKAVILEADVEDYPGMFVTRNIAGNGFQGVFAPYPLEEYQGGFHKLNTMASKRADYIATVKGTRNFPWRVVVIAEKDADLLNNDMVQKLASPSRVADVSWIKPGKVAWDWWNDWNISHVDFRAGINTETYKYYIDFASDNKIEYIIIDEGWSNDLDLMDVSSKMNLKEIIDYGKTKNVGVILWAGWYAVDQKMEEAFARYAGMGVKGFKIDFMDRDDQKMVSSLYKISQRAADYKLLLDYHGMYKPTGFQRTYPNVLNFEGVKGMENNKWTPNDDVPRYDVSIPFIRMVAGPMDYTPGAMRNSVKAYFRPVHSNPMSQGTRAHQLSMYIVFEAPLNMLADNPTAYKKEQESTDFIAKVPTTFSETVALDGNVGKYVTIARRKGDTWFVGAMSNWNARNITIDLSFLGDGNYEAEIFKDGINADRDATDYKKEIIKVSSQDKLNVYLAPGGGWAARIYKK
jgi:alpha-glucosidase